MKALSTLLWLEFRKSPLVAVFLAATVLIWIWCLPSIATFFASSFGQTSASLGRLGLTLIGPGLVGVLALFATFFSSGREGKQGQLQFLLMTPQSGYVHALARFVYLILLAVFFFVPLVGLAWFWDGNSTGYSAGDSAFVLFFALAAVFAILLPVLAAMVLTDVMLSTYRLRGHFGVPVFVTSLGFTFLFHKLSRLADATAHSLFPAVQVPQSLQSEHFFWLNGIPLEQFAIALVATAVFLLLAGRVWEEVEA